MIKTRIYTPKDLKKCLRLKVCKAEIKELNAQGFKNPKLAIKKSLEDAKVAWYFTKGKKVVAISGITQDPLYENTCLVWCLISENIMAKHLFTFNSLAYDGLDVCFKQLNYDLAYNYVSLNNTKSIKWLKRLGFEFLGHPRSFKDKKTYFDCFYMYKEDYLYV